ncbi:MAG: hypothetical protein WB919_16715 [Candidatus Sulfotelmatobacter sp.]
MKKIMWGLLALAECILAFLLARHAIFNILRIALTRWAVLAPNAWYFAGMLFGGLLHLLVPSLLIYHAVRIVRSFAK